MARTVDQMIDDVVEREGGFVDHPADRGGPTKFGITQRTLSHHLGRPATLDEVRGLQRHVAKDIYRREYYVAPHISLLPERIRAFVLDSAVNHGPAPAVRLVQQVCNAAGFGPVVPDGICGPQTQAAARAADEGMGDWFLAALVEERRNYYRRIVTNDPGQRVFLDGWLNRIAEFDVAERLVA